MTEKLNPNTKPQTALSDEELDSVTGGTLVTMNADGTFSPVSEKPIMKPDLQGGPNVELMLKNIKNAPPIEQPHTQAQADFAKHLQKRYGIQ